MNTFRWGIIGSGHIAKKMSRNLFSDKSNVLCGVYSRNKNSAMKMAEIYGGIVANTIEEFLSLDLDGIYIATPQSSHYNYIRLCLLARKPVICEKPMVINCDQMNEIIRIAKEKNTYLNGIMSYKYSPIYNDWKSIIKDSDLGNITSVKVEIGFDAINLQKRQRTIAAEYAGGALLETGVYAVSFLNNLFGDFDSIEADSILSKEGIDLHDKIIFIKDKIKFEIECSLMKLMSSEAKIYFENGLLVMPFFNRGCSYTLYKNSNIIKNKTVPIDCMYQFNENKIEIIEGKIESIKNSFFEMLKEQQLLDRIRELIGVQYSQNIEKI